VVDDLSHGHLANLAEARRRGGVRFHRMDVSQGGLATLAGRVRADAWVHLATAIDPTRAWEDPTGEARAVVPGAVELLRAAAATGVRAVLASSGAYLYPAQLTGATRAGDTPRPLHPFGAARLAMEAYAGAFAARGLDVVTLVLGTVYGPRQDPLGPGLVARAAWSMLQGQPPRVDGDGRQERDFLFVDDAVDAVARAVHASPPPGRVLVGTGAATSVLAVVEQLSARIGSHTYRRRQGPGLAALDPPGRGARAHRGLAQGPAAEPPPPHRALTRPSLVITPYVEFSSRNSPTGLWWALGPVLIIALFALLPAG
jgi:UDP-glucose 4-epimerase